MKALLDNFHLSEGKHFEHKRNFEIGSDDLVEEGAENNFELVLYVLICHLKIVLNVVSCQVSTNLFTIKIKINNLKSLINVHE